MIELAAAQARLLALAKPVAIERVSLVEATGRWLAERLIAARTQPARDLSAMDGYAIRFADLPGPWTCIGESAAGRAFHGILAENQAVRIFTGALLPAGADTVIVQEDVAAEGARIRMTGDGPTAANAHVRPKGADFKAGEVLAETGAYVTPGRVGLAAMAGYDTLAVRRRIKIALVSTGDELVPPGSDAGPEQIPSSNAVMLSGLLQDSPVEIHDHGIVQDDVDKLTSEFRSLCEYDVVVTLGGASVGDHDLVRPALEAAGAQMDFWKVAMRPGKPVMAGTMGNAIVLGLPGNPVSAFVTALLFLKPLIAHMGGAADPLPQSVSARLGANLPANGPRTDHLRACVTDRLVHPVGVNDSAMLAALSLANALIIRAPEAPSAQTGDLVEIILLP
jgi:molybdopterin molybdotransferase